MLRTVACRVAAVRNSSSLPSIAVNATTNSPIPINVEAVYHAPLKLPINHGDLVCELHLRSYDHENMDFFSDFALRAAYYLGMPVTGPKPLPTKRERWTVIRSPFAQAKSKENFERHTHKRVIKVWDTNPEVVDMWLGYISKHSISGVGLKANVFQREGLELNWDEAELKVPEGAKSDEVIGKRVLELLNDPLFKKYL